MTEDQCNQDEERRTTPSGGSETSESLHGSPEEYGGGAPRKRSKRAPSVGSGARDGRRSRRRGAPRPELGGEGIIELPVRQRADNHRLESPVSESLLGELEAQGFTEDEAYHLIDVSDRIANSRETREAEAIIRRLRFNRWLFEQGKLSEFSA